MEAHMMSMKEELLKKIEQRQIVAGVVGLGYVGLTLAERAMHILNRHKKAINGAKVLMLGVSYKNDIDDYWESPAILKDRENIEVL